MLNWCGYVTIPNDHPDFNSSNINKIYNFHGGVTYDDSNGTYGFDCAHYTDIVPYTESSMYRSFGETLTIPNFRRRYWTFEDVKKETNRLAKLFYNRMNEVVV